MKRNDVDSSMIKSIGWEDDTLEVEFIAGKVFQYEGVPSNIFDDLMSSASVGSFFHQNVRNSYTFKEV